MGNNILAQKKKKKIHLKLWYSRDYYVVSYRLDDSPVTTDVFERFGGHYQETYRVIPQVTRALPRDGEIVSVSVPWQCGLNGDDAQERIAADFLKCFQSAYEDK